MTHISTINLRVDRSRINLADNKIFIFLPTLVNSTPLDLLHKILRIMHELPWITIFGSRVRRFANDFHEWRSHEWKSLANRITSDPKIVIHGNECIILFLTRYLMSWTHNSAENNHRSLVSQLSPRTIVSGLALWRHRSGSVTSREREILALWRHICRLFLHAQIGAKAIFTSE